MDVIFTVSFLLCWRLILDLSEKAKGDSSVVLYFLVILLSEALDTLDSVWKYKPGVV